MKGVHRMDLFRFFLYSQAAVKSWMTFKDSVGYNVGAYKRKGAIGSHWRRVRWFLPQSPMLHLIVFPLDLWLLQIEHRWLQEKEWNPFHELFFHLQFIRSNPICFVLWEYTITQALSMTLYMYSLFLSHPS